MLGPVRLLPVFRFCTSRSFCSENGKIPAPIVYTKLVWFCKPGHEKLLAEELELNTPGKASISVHKGWIRIKHDESIPSFTEPAWGRVCMHNYEKFTHAKESELLNFAHQFCSSNLREMMKCTHVYSQWQLFAYEPIMNAHQGLNSALGKGIRKKLMEDKKFKRRLQKKGSPEGGDMMLQMFMPTKNSVILSASFAETDHLGREQPLHWLGGHYKAKHNKGPSKADTKIQEAFAHFDIEDEQIEDAHFVELGGAPGGWTSFILEKGGIVTSVDLAKSEINHANHKHIQGDAKEQVETFKDGVDWLVADLSMPPDTSLDLLYQYLIKEIPKRFMWSLKFAYHPNDNWNEVLQNARKMFAQQLPKYDFRIRHLFYQKREILIWGQHVSVTEEFENLRNEVDGYVEDVANPEEMDEKDEELNKE